MTERKAPAKPKFLVVESTLKCQTENGEFSLPLKVKWGKIRKLFAAENMSQTEEFEFFLNEIFTPEQNDFLDELDGAEVAEILGQFSEHLAERMKVSMGKSGGSSD